MQTRIPFAVRALVTLLLAAVLPSAAGAQSAQERIKQRVETLREAGGITVVGKRPVAAGLLPLVYERRAFVPLWSGADDRAALRRAIAVLEYDGLDPEHYHLSELERWADLPDDVVTRAEADLLHTDALLRAALDLRFGRVDPATNRKRGEVPAGEEGAFLNGILGIAPAAALQSARPRHTAYEALRGALRQLVDIRQSGGWIGVPAIRMESGTEDAAVAALRRRLKQEGDLPTGADTTSLRFDAQLDSAVRSYQHRHALDVDGIVGPATHRTLNTDIAERISAVQVNLERARWVLHDLADTFVAVNAAGALVYYVRNGRALFEARAIVGQPYTQTPTFTAAMRYIDLNPTWTVPPGIVSEVLAAIRRNPGYLRAQNMRVLDRSGNVVNPAHVDFTRYSARTFPYVFRQEPGPLNPLGLVKFVFPNRHNVYLHDTPARELFERTERTFSHGCIRVQNPVALAALVLDDPEWSAERLRAAIAEGRLRSIQLRRPLPVLILYWTASADLHGELHFYPDIYERDGAVLRALRTP
jgi:L,D-transpeptidase YcbB